jgi:flagellar hook-basal body complex protein FliE
MVDNINASLNITPGVGAAISAPATGASAAPAGGTSFADVLKNSIEEVNRMQQDASQAVEDLATGKSENVTGVMTAMAKSDLAFNTLLTIRAKLMDAYNEIKNIAL